MLGVVCGYDTLKPDTILFRNQCEATCIGGEWLEWDKQMLLLPNCR